MIALTGENMKRKVPQDDCDPLEMQRVQVDLQSPDEATRARAIRFICPCHAGWQPFEHHMKIVAELQKDPSPLVRSVAKHVFEDAAEMESGGYPTNPRETSNEMLCTRRASRFPREPEEVTSNAGDRRRRR